MQYLVWTWGYHPNLNPDVLKCMHHITSYLILEQRFKHLGPIWTRSYWKIFCKSDFIAKSVCEIKRKLENTLKESFEKKIWKNIYPNGPLGFYKVYMLNRVILSYVCSITSKTRVIPYILSGNLRKPLKRSRWLTAPTTLKMHKQQ